MSHIWKNRINIYPVITQEDLQNFAIDLEDKDYIVSYGNLPDHKAYRYDDREQLELSIKKNFKKSGQRYFSLNDYSEIFDNIEELHDRIDEEYRLINIIFEFAFSSGIPLIDSQTFVNNWIKSLPNEDDIYNRIEISCERIRKEVKKKFGDHVDHPTPKKEFKIIDSINFTFKCRKYEKIQSDNNLKRLYNSLEDKDGEIKKKMRDLFTDTKFEGIKRFNKFT